MHYNDRRNVIRDSRGKYPQTHKNIIEFYLALQ